jgi:glutathione S-transferase
MKLYYSKGACSLSVHITINEMGLPCEWIAVDLKTKKTKDGDDFYKINPKGEVATLQLDNGEILTENAVILQYLADQYKRADLLPPPSDFKRYKILEWVNFITTDIHKGFGPLFNSEVPLEVKERIFIPALKRKFALVDAHLTDQEFIAADHYTLPDGYLFVMITWLFAFKIELSEWKALAAYFERIKARPAVQKSLDEEGLKF